MKNVKGISFIPTLIFFSATAFVHVKLIWLVYVTSRSLLAVYTGTILTETENERSDCYVFLSKIHGRGVDNHHRDPASCTLFPAS